MIEVANVNERILDIDNSHVLMINDVTIEN